MTVAALRRGGRAHSTVARRLDLSRGLAAPDGRGTSRSSVCRGSPATGDDRWSDPFLGTFVRVSLSRSAYARSLSRRQASCGGAVPARRCCRAPGVRGEAGRGGVVGGDAVAGGCPAARGRPSLSPAAGGTRRGSGLHGRGDGAGGPAWLAVTGLSWAGDRCC